MLPRRSWRHALIGRATRIWFWLTGIRLSINGDAAHLPERVVIVANHSSFLDGAVLSAAIPGELTFVAKHEFSETFWAGTFLRRLGTVFVKRVDRTAGLQGRDELISAVKHGERLIVFPEGTLLRRPGILSFRLGAFAAATAASAAVVPVAIHGTRDVLRGEQWFPRRGAIAVDVGAPMAASGSGFEAELKLRDTARTWILKHVTNPILQPIRSISPRWASSQAMALSGIAGRTAVKRFAHNPVRPENCRIDDYKVGVSATDRFRRLAVDAP